MATTARDLLAREITRKTDEPGSAHQADEDVLAASLKRKAVREVAATEWELERGQAAARVSQVVDYMFYVV